MFIFFERGRDYEKMRDFDKNLAEDYLLGEGKEFASISDALNQYLEGGAMLWTHFYVVPQKIAPRELPCVIRQTTISPKIDAEGRKAEISGLTAKIVDFIGPIQL